jgi:hypothetical protein
VRSAQLLLLAGTAGVIPFLLTATASATGPKRVLLVHSFGRAAPIPALSLSFESELTAKMDGPVDLDEVSVDMARYADPEMQEAVAEYLEKHMAKWRPDLVVPMAAPAAMFVAPLSGNASPLRRDGSAEPSAGRVGAKRGCGGAGVGHSRLV